MTGGGRGAPRVAGWIIDLLEGGGGGGPVRGDLDEEYADHVLPSVGPRRARLWYWRQTILSAPGLVVRRTRSDRGGWLGRRWHDLAAAWRAVRRRPAGSLAPGLTLALALAANIGVFAVVNGVLLRPLPWDRPDELVRIHPDELFYFRLSDAQRFAERAPFFERVVPWGRTLFTLTGDGAAEELRGARVQWDHFEMLGVRPAVGRFFVREDALSEPYGSVVLSHGVWRRRFGSDPAVVGRVIDVNGRPRTVIGVVSREHVPIEADWEMWAPLPLDAESAAGMALAANARLRSGVTLDQAQAAARETFAAVWLEDGYRATPEDLAAIRVIGLRDHILGDISRPLYALLGAVLLVLLLACANVANLLLSQTTRRRHEMAVRVSLGASRWRVVVQLLMEVTLVAGLAAVAGLWVAWALVQWMSISLPADIPRVTGLGIDGAVGAWAAVCTLVAVAVSAAPPALRLAFANARGGLATGVRGGSASRGRLSDALIAVEVAISVVLVIGAGLLLRSFGAILSVDPGFEAAGVVTVRVNLPSGRYDETGSLDGVYRRIVESAAGSPGATSAGAMMFLPLTSGGAWSAYRLPADPVDDDDAPVTAFRVVTPGYFETLGVPVMGGRSFTTADNASSPPVAVINETLARHAYGLDDPVGRRLVLGSTEPVELTVIGVVGDVRQTDLRTPSHPEIYLPLSQSPFGRMYVVARSDAAAPIALSRLQDAIRSVEPDVVLSRAASLTDLLHGSVAEARLLTQLMGLFGLVSLALGAIGVYGVAAHAVARSRREIGIRMALGETASRVFSRVVRAGMAPVALGIGAGGIAALWTSRVLTSLLFEVEPRDPVTFAVVGGVLAGTALVALALPAGRAGRIQPAAILRDE